MPVFTEMELTHARQLHRGLSGSRFPIAAAIADALRPQDETAKLERAWFAWEKSGVALLSLIGERGIAWGSLGASLDHYYTAGALIGTVYPHLTDNIREAHVVMRGFQFTSHEQSQLTRIQERWKEQFPQLSSTHKVMETGGLVIAHIVGEIIDKRGNPHKIKIGFSGIKGSQLPIPAGRYYLENGILREDPITHVENILFRRS